MDAPTLASIVTAILVVLLIPGPIMATVVGNALAGGLPSGLYTVGGVVVGKTALLALLIGSISLAQEQLPGVVRVAALLGGLYLLWAGCSTLWSAPDETPVARCASNAFASGLAVALGSPSGLVFYTAMVMPFIEPDHAIGQQLCLLGGLYLLIGILFHGLCAFVAGSLGNYGRHTRFARVVVLACAATYVATGLLAIRASLAMTLM